LSAVLLTKSGELRRFALTPQTHSIAMQSRR
jgi:hypothetical protein